MEKKILLHKFKKLFFIFAVFIASLNFAKAQDNQIAGTKAFCKPDATKNAKQASIQSPLKSVLQKITVFNTDFVSAGVGGLRIVGNGTLSLSGVTGSVTQAYLYWHGLTNSSTNVGNPIIVNGTSVNGVNIGYSDSNCRGTNNSQAYRADVTSLVQSTGNGNYALSGFGAMDANGASLIVFFNDGNSANNRDVVIFDGNDSNIFFGGIGGNPDAPVDPEGWNVLLSGINYSSGTANIQLHVADGQVAGDAALLLNSATLEPRGPIFEGLTVPGPQPFGDGNQWDIRSWNVTSFLSPGLNNLNLTTGVASDCLGLIVALIDLPAGAAPPITNFQFDYPPTPNNNQVFNLNVGQNLTFDVSATKTEQIPASPSKTASATVVGVTLNVSGLPAGASFPSVSNLNPAISTFSWTPSASDVGSRTVTFSAMDEATEQQIFTSVIINVVGEIVNEINAPQNLRVQTLGCDALKLTWEDIIGASEESYEVYRSSEGPGGPFQLISTPIANATEYIDRTVWPNGTFHYYVRGRFSDGFSPNSNVAMGIATCEGPGPTQVGMIPGIRVYPISCSELSVQWDDVVGRSEESYELYRSKDTPAGPYVAVGQPAANTGVWVDGQLNSDTKYYYIIRARFSDGFSDYTIATGATTNKINLKLTSYCATRAILDWDNCTSQREKWTIKASTDNITFNTIGETDALINHFEAINLKPNTTYYFVVQPSYSNGFSNWSNMVWAKLNMFPAPTELKAVYASGKVNLTWMDNSNGCDNEEEFEILRKAPGGEFEKIGHADANKPTFQDGGVSTGKEYCYYIKPRSFYGFEPVSNTACITIPTAATNSVSLPVEESISIIKSETVDNSESANGKIASKSDVGIGENRRFIFDLNIYPNPVVSELKFAFNKNIDGATSIKIYDNMGKELIMTTLNQIEQNKEYKLDISSLSEGQFFLKVQPFYYFKPMVAKFLITR